MADAMETLKGLLGDDAEDKIKSVVSSLSDSSGGGANDNSLEYIMQMRDIMSKITNDKNDPRSRLLMSLRPYMRTERRNSIDNAVRLLNITKLAGVFRQQ